MSAVYLCSVHWDFNFVPISCWSPSLSLLLPPSSLPIYWHCAFLSCSFVPPPSLSSSCSKYLLSPSCLHPPLLPVFDAGSPALLCVSSPFVFPCDHAFPFHYPSQPSFSLSIGPLILPDTRLLLSAVTLLSLVVWNLLSL